jgi:major type 1 subunit fimbrin (pilin)
MNMKPALLTAALVAAGLTLMAPAAQALQNPGPDGTITFTGKVIAQTCKVNSNGSGTANATVALPSVLTTNLATTGDVAGKTPFSIVISGCDASLGTAQAYWSGANVDAATGNLKNASGGGNSNVQVQMLNAGNAVMPLNGATATAQNSQVVNLNNGGATLNYSAQYIAATAPANAGAVNTSVAFTVIYQ